MAGHFKYKKYVDQWVALYNSGKSYLEIAKLFACSTVAVRKNLNGLVFNRSYYKTTKESFYGSLSKKEDTNCWEWEGAENGKGYGMTTFRGQPWATHRLSYFLTFGEFEKELFVCHTCDNRRCCNPDHLFLGTCYDNSIDMVKKGRGNTMILEEKQVVLIRELTQNENANCADVAREYGVHRSTINKIKNNKNWGHLELEKRTVKARN